MLHSCPRRFLLTLGPIEQRFSGSSRAHLSPCSDADPGAVFMWMNNILYRVHPDVEQLWPEYSEMLREVGNLSCQVNYL